MAGTLRRNRRERKMLKQKLLFAGKSLLVIILPSEKFLRTDLTRAQPRPRSEAGVTWTLLRPRGRMCVHLTTLRPMIILPGVAPPGNKYFHKIFKNILTWHAQGSSVCAERLKHTNNHPEVRSNQLKLDALYKKCDSNLCTSSRSRIS
mgnify:FL=1